MVLFAAKSDKINWMTSFENLFLISTERGLIYLMDGQLKKKIEFNFLDHHVKPFSRI